MNLNRFILPAGLGALALVLALGCNEQKGTAVGGKSAPGQPVNTGAGAGAAAHGAPAGQPQLTPEQVAAMLTTVNGEVLETMDAGGYTYMRVKTANGEAWAAGPLTKLKVGDQVATPPGGPMKNFESRTLGRKFEVIYFVPKIAVGTDGSAPALAAGAPPAMAGQPASAPTQPASAPTAAAGAPDMANHQPPKPAELPAGATLTGIAKADGGYTVGEIYGQKAELAGKPVKLRARVVKFNARIMGRNWLHVQDGSGDAGTNDLTVTTNGEAAVGDLVLIEGTLGLDRDFGPNYKYPVIVETAALTKE